MKILSSTAYLRGTISLPSMGMSTWWSEKMSTGAASQTPSLKMFWLCLLRLLSWQVRLFEMELLGKSTSGNITIRSSSQISKTSSLRTWLKMNLGLQVSISSRAFKVTLSQTAQRTLISHFSNKTDKKTTKTRSNSLTRRSNLSVRARSWSSSNKPTT